MQLLQVNDESGRSALAAAAAAYSNSEEDNNTALGMKVVAAAMNLANGFGEKPLFLVNGAKKRDTPEDVTRYGEIGEIVDTNEVNNFVVRQGEFGIIPAVPSATVPQYIMSTDATTCMLVAARGTLKATVGDAQKVVSATALGHFDTEGEDLSEGVFNMYFRSLLPALRVLADGSIDLDEIAIIKGEATVPSISAAELSVEWYLVGGMVDEKHSLPIIADLFSHSLNALWDSTSDGALEDQRENIFGATAEDRPFTVSHSLRPDGVCFWEQNTTMKKTCCGGEATACIANGLRINANTGECHPCWTKVGTRNHPLASIRNLKFLSGFPPSPLHPLAETLSAGENNESYRKVAPTSTGVGETVGETVQITFLTHLQSVVKCMQAADERTQHFPVLVYSFPISDISHMKGLTLDDAEKFSTTPHCEPSDFAEEMLKTIEFALSTSSAKMFGKSPLPIGTY